MVTPYETGWRVGGRLHWPWAFATPDATVYAIRKGRGLPEAASILGADLAGVLIRDGWAPYRKFTAAAHQSCLAHLLRRCRLLRQGHPRRRLPEAVRRVLRQALARFAIATTPAPCLPRPGRGERPPDHRAQRRPRPPSTVADVERFAAISPWKRARNGAARQAEPEALAEQRGDLAERHAELFVERGRERDDLRAQLDGRWPERVGRLLCLAGGWLSGSPERRPRCVIAGVTVTNPAEPPVYTSCRPRRFGCDGYPLSEQLKTKLEARTGESWSIYDKAQLELVSQDEQLPMKVLSDLGNPCSSADAIGRFVPADLRQSDVFTHIPKSIIRIAQAGHAIGLLCDSRPRPSFGQRCGIENWRILQRRQGH